MIIFHKFGHNFLDKCLDRRLLELCVVTEVMQELQSGDLYVPDSERYSDYRDQLVSDEECRQALAS